jgi:ribosomal protein S18 acetylase RimI-like enzyme
MDDLRVRPMTPGEFGPFRTRLVREYAADHVRAGNWTEDEAEALAAEQTDALVPQGVDTPGQLLLVAETADGEVIGHVWIGLERRPGFPEAWIYSIEIAADRRGRGYGRALLAASELETARRGAKVLGLNVFGPNTVARKLYESAGYEVATLQMRKELDPAP